MKTRLIYFSPCGTTARIADAIAAGLGYPDAVGVDLSVPENRRIPYTCGFEEVTVLAFPVYHGRLPDICVPFLERLPNGMGAPAVIAVNTGGEEAGDALRTLYSLVIKAGFSVIGAAQTVSRHCFAPVLAKGRPNEKDFEGAIRFGQSLNEKLKGQWEPIRLTPMAPSPGELWPSFEIAVSDKCAGCGLCARNCVVGAINPHDPTETDRGRCIFCMRCIYRCPNSARTPVGEEFQKKSRFVELTNKGDCGALYYF